MNKQEVIKMLGQLLEWVCDKVIPGLSERDLSEEVAAELRSF